MYLNVHSWDSNILQLAGQFHESAAGGELDRLPLLPMNGDVVIGQVDVGLAQLLHGMDQGRLLGMESAN